MCRPSAIRSLDRLWHGLRGRHKTGPDSEAVCVDAGALPDSEPPVATCIVPAQAFTTTTEPLLADATVPTDPAVLAADRVRGTHDGARTK